MERAIWLTYVTLPIIFGTVALYFGMQTIATFIHTFSPIYFMCLGQPLSTS